MTDQIAVRSLRSPGVETDDDEIPTALLARAKAGDVRARESLFEWAYFTAGSYYRAKVPVERSLTDADAEELAGAFLLEFHRAWPRMELVCHYTRRMLRNNLRRYLRRKRLRHGRERPVALEHTDDRLEKNLHAWDEHVIEALCDADRRQVELVRRALRETDPVTRRLMTLRCGEPPMTYRQIAHRLGSSETALRMRAARFYRRVRRTWTEREESVTEVRGRSPIG